MGVRLYPSTTDPRILEKLAGVPEGTTRRLEGFEGKKSTMGEEQWHEELFADEELHALLSFDLFGWGRLNRAASEFLTARDEDHVVGEVSGEAAAELMKLQGVVLPEGVTLNSVNWG